MKSYGEYCPVAKTLDVVGDRWTMLIVRELSIRDACRYTDLRNGLPGIASNLLVERLRELEQDGIITREDAPPPVATAVFRLTPRGQELGDVLRALAAWGTPLLLRPAKGDVVRAHWLSLPVQLYLRDTTPDRPPVSVVIRAGGESLTIETTGNGLSVRTGESRSPTAILSGSPQLIVSVLTGGMTLSDASAWGLVFEGDPAAVARLQPRAGDPRGFALQQQLL